MRSQQVKTNFASGVMSPRVALRSDSEKFDGALEECRNWIVTPQGGLLFREGFKNFSLSTDPTADSRIFQFHNGGDVSDMVCHVTAGDGLIHFFIDGVIQADTVAHNYLVTELDDLYFTNQENLALIMHPDHPPLYIEIQLDGSITGEEMPSNLIPLFDYDDANAPTASTQGDATYSTDWINGTATTWNPSRNWVLKYDGVYASGNQGNPKEFEFSSVAATLANRVQQALELIPALKGTGTTISVLPGLSGTNFPLIEITITGEAGGKLIEIEPANSDADRYVTVTPSIDFNDVLEPAWSFPTYVLHGGVYYQCILPHTPDDPSNVPPNATYWTSLSGKPSTFDWQYPDGNAWSASAVQYSPGGRGFPTVAVVHQQRLEMMASPFLSMGIWGSRIGNYKDFVLGPQDDDPFFFAIDTSDTPTIKWAAAQRKLLLGTSSGDYQVDAQVTLAPSDVQAERQNNARSHGTAPITINTDVFYIEQGKEKVRTTGYLDELNSQTSKDISIIAEHLLHDRIKRLTLLMTPEVMIVGLLDTGQLVGITYSHENNVGAWYEFETQGEIIDICGGYSVINDEDELWAIVTYDGGVTRYLEKMPYPARVKTYQTETTDPALVDQGIVHLDGWVSGTISTGDNNIIQGLEQFEGLTVACLVDNSYTGEYTVNDGAIILEAPDPGDVPAYSGTYAVGFSFTGYAKTFEQHMGNPRGTALGTKRRWNKLYVHFLDSALVKINGQLPEDRSPGTAMSVAEIWREGLRGYSVANLGWGDGANTIEQDMPYPSHVLGFYGEYSTENS